MMNKSIGIYIHVPFCKGKCRYCDFYSVSFRQELAEQYTRALCSAIRAFPVERPADTVYFGGGTPNLLGARNLLAVLEAVNQRFCLGKNAEITAEVNPGDQLPGLLKQLYAGGFNRLSIGMQSAHDRELKLLGRRHDFADTQRAVEAACRAGFERYSLDLMLAIPEQTQENLALSAHMCGQLGASHVSAYLLKIEPGTDFDRQKETLALPDEDTVCSFYQEACALLEAEGLLQYEISNFAQPGQESRHNLKYWLDEEYIGFGPAAYSYLDGRRFHFDRDLEGFLRGATPVYDEQGGGLEEFLMMRLRLCRGIERKELDLRFGNGTFAALAHKAHPFLQGGFVTLTADRVALTRDGFLLSNYIITRLLPET